MRTRMHDSAVKHCLQGGVGLEDSNSKVVDCGDLSLFKLLYWSNVLEKHSLAGQGEKENSKQCLSGSARVLSLQVTLSSSFWETFITKTFNKLRRIGCKVSIREQKNQMCDSYLR